MITSTGQLINQNIELQYILFHLKDLQFKDLRKIISHLKRGKHFPND